MARVAIMRGIFMDLVATMKEISAFQAFLNGTLFDLEDIMRGILSDIVKQSYIHDKVYTIY
jgi:hypothetical protein